MNYQVYFPNDLTRSLGGSTIPLYVLGYKFENVYVVTHVSEQEFKPKSLPPTLKGIKVVGTFTSQESSPEKYDLKFRFDQELNLPYLSDLSSHAYSIILFDPPNFKKLEYLSVKPILLQSMGNESEDGPQEKLIEQIELFEPLTQNSNQLSISSEEVLDRINSVLKIRIDFQTWEATPQKNRLKKKSFTSLNEKAFSDAKGNAKPLNAPLRALILLVKAIQSILISIIWLLNYKVHGYNLINTSNVIRQLDLRLKQFNYFPVQFLCYYDKTVLYNEDNLLLKRLKLPIFNSNLNINNSNYINLHNSSWLIFNDILLGITAYDFFIYNFDPVMKFLHKVCLQKFLYNSLVELINWVATNHPAGFKLNDELGHFMGDLYMWSLTCWKFIVNDFIETKLSTDLKFRLLEYFKTFLMVLCYCGGLSFLLGFMIDVIEKFTFHISCFYFTSTKVYNRQIETIKSLFQLFRGKKYNVLRNRIDNLNNYVIGSSNPFEIDQLLLGTLMFMVLMLLLPTVFAFYFTFFLLRLLILVALNFLENIQILVTFTPLFVLVLKLKNSKRLQGGIKLHYLSSHHGINYIKLSNKSLTYHEIFTNFIKLFTAAKNFRTKILQTLVTGELLTTKYNYNLKFHYLMLPENYEKTIDIWEGII